MARLVTMIGYGVMLWWAQSSSAATYVPGEVRDGVYVRPHFMVASEKAGKPPFVGVDKGSPEDAERHADPAVLQQPTLPPPAEDASS